MSAQPSRTPFDPDDAKAEGPDLAEDNHLTNRTHKEADLDDELEEAVLDEDLVELDEDDLKNMEGPDA